MLARLMDSPWRYVTLVIALLLLGGTGFWMISPGGSRLPDNNPSGSRSEPVSKVDPELRKIVDDWIERNKLNRYGDPPNVHYTGGTPLFDPSTGITRDRYEYILEKHPELKKK
jgi:hypothetical protein